MMTHRRRGAALVALAATILALGAAGCGDDGDEAADHTTAIGFSQIADSGVSGQVDLTQDGTRVTGNIEVSGLEPGTAHAMHIHGMAGKDHGCAEDERTSEHLINLPDVTADDEGVGRIEIDIEGPADAIREGTYIMVHQNPTPASMDGDMSGDTLRGDADATSQAGLILVHAGEDHSTQEEAEAHRAKDNPPIACAEFTDR
jgi:hypothetical protein